MATRKLNPALLDDFADPPLLLPDSNRTETAHLAVLSVDAATPVDAHAQVASAAPLLQAATALSIVDIIPNSDSGETSQNSEPSLGVDPLDPNQMVAGVFGAGTPYFKTTTGGTIWSDYGSLNTEDKTIAWKQDGSAVLTATLVGLPGNKAEINTYSGTTANSSFGSPINTFNPGRDLDQPWMRTGASNHVYVGYNDLSASSTGKTASVLVSTNGGSSYTNVTLDRVGAAPAVGQDAPAIRLAVNGSTVYSVFTRWNSIVESDANGERFGSQVVVVRSDNGGADGFTALGAGGNGVQVATPTSYFSSNSNTPLTLGQERTSADTAIAVDPNNSQHVLIAYGNAPGANGSGQLQLTVTESTNGGATWTTKFTTSSSVRSGLPALAIAQNGTIGLLYDSYDPSTNKMSQHLLTTANDFVSTTDITLGTESNATPVSQFHPYIGDFFDMTSVGNTFYGIFSASNADDGTNAQFTNVTFQRNFIGTPGTSSFRLTNQSGNPIATSIDPFFFSFNTSTAAPPVFVRDDLDGDGKSDVLLQNLDGTPQIWLMNGASATSMTSIVNPGPTWHLDATGDVNLDGKADLIWQNDDGRPAIWEMNGTAIIGGGLLISPGPSWHLIAAGDFNADGRSDILWQNIDGAAAIWEMNGTAIVGGGVIANPGAAWRVIGAGDFDDDGHADILWQNNDGAPLIWEMNGTTIVGGGILLKPGPSWQAIGTGDFNADGHDDILWQNSDGTPAIWEMNGTAIIGGGLLLNPGASWHAIGTSDFNGDGHADIIWQNTDGTPAVWEMNGTAIIGGGVLPNPGPAWQVKNDGPIPPDQMSIAAADSSLAASGNELHQFAAPHMLRT
jgi:FG-GAP-like repeat